MIAFWDTAYSEVKPHGVMGAAKAHDQTTCLKWPCLSVSMERMNEKASGTDEAAARETV